MSGFLIALAIGVALFLILSRVRDRSARQHQPATANQDRIEHKLTGSTWATLEESLVAGMHQQDFWNRPERFDVLERYALIDRVKAAVGTARGLEARLSRSAGRGGRYSRDLVSRLASQIYLIQHGVDDVLTHSPVEIVLTVQPALDADPDHVASARWCERVLEMYRRWVSRRHMQWDDLPRPAPQVPALVVVSGFGAARILGRDAGLHLLEYEDAREEAARAVARVKIAPTPSTLPDAPAQRFSALTAELDRAPAVPSVVRRYKLGASPLIRDVHGWRTGRQDLVLDGDFDLLGEVLGAAK